MFRRRPFRPFRFRPPGRPPLPPVAPRVRRALRRAHEALARGDAAEAAAIFHRLGEEAERRAMPLRAAVAFAEAAHAEALGDNPQKAVEDAGRAVEIAAHLGRPGRIAPAVGRVIEALRRKGYEAEAAELESRLDAALEAAGTSRGEVAARLAAARGKRRGQLPPKCEACGAPLLPDEVEWHDATTASCPYCGSPVKVM
ncbi:MAG TPA: hypothetical protein ENK08_08935 [Chloroflexi bacterium]|nr:hypothetical protein [Chloroflexota bacterium]